MGEEGHAGAPLHRGAVREGEAAQGRPDRRLPPRDHGDRGAHAGAGGGRREGRPVRLEPPVDAGRGGRLPREERRHRRLRDQGGEPEDVLRAHPRGPRRGAPHDDGRRGGPGLDGPLGEEGVPEGDRRRHRGDDHGRHPAERDGREGRPAVPHHRGERGEDEALLRQPVRNGAVDARRHPPGDEPAAGGELFRRGRLRLVRTRTGDAGPGDGRARDRHRDRSRFRRSRR